MKIVKLGETFISKEAVEQKLGIQILKWILPKDDNFLKIYTKHHIVYLRCEDMQRLFGLDVNIFDDAIELTKDKLTLKNKEEVYRGKAKHFDKIFKR